jgi:hypothetical protein
MPTSTQERVQGYVSCSDSTCLGYEQRQTDVVRETTAFTYHDNGALPSDPVPATAVERESVRVVQPAGECEHCGKPLLFTDQSRPEYPQVSGQDDNALRNLNTQKQIHAVEVDGLKRDRELAEMRAQMAELTAELQRRKGGRPPKEDNPA